MIRQTLATLICVYLMVSVGCASAQSNDEFIDDSILGAELLEALELAASQPDPELRLRAYDRGFLLVMITLAQEHPEVRSGDDKASVQIAELTDDIHQAALSSGPESQLRAYDRIIEYRFGFAVNNGEAMPESSSESVSPDLSTERPATLTYFQAIGEIRGVTSDRPRRTFVVEPVLGFDPENRQLQAELTQMMIPIREEIDFYFSSRTADHLLDAASRRQVKEELEARINSMLRTGEVQDVAFQTYQIVDF